MRTRSLKWPVLAAALLALPALPASAGSYSNLETSGDVLTAALPIMSYGVALLKGDGEGEHEFLRSNVASLIVTSVLRVGFNQTSLGARPNGNRYAFPSGHVAFITASAAFLQDRYGWKYGVPAYLAVGYVSWVRLENRHHRTRDVLAGAAVSIGVSKLFVTPAGATYIAPIVGPDWIGMRIERSF
jgi:membrane-associated phospholipid phosphatase